MASIFIYSSKFLVLILWTILQSHLSVILAKESKVVKTKDSGTIKKDGKVIARDKLKGELLTLFKKSDELSVKQNFANWNYDSDLSKKNAIALVSASNIYIRV